MAELKTKKTEESVEAFLNTVTPDQKRKDSIELVKIMSAILKAEPKMWGSSIIGFGYRQLKYDSGRELDWFISGFSPRKANIVLYLSGGAHQSPDLLSRLGKHKTGKGCLYINTLADVDMKVLKEMIKGSAKII